ncbi:FAD dependent oxidoreductase [Penicillium freii]|nr:FAD dependent oxidoreductase [Penicillium freii]
MLTSNIKTSRSLPNPTPCLSYWQRTTRAYPNLHANIETTVPSNSKYVIVGSGISGGLTAFKLIEGGAKAEDIVILEAREAASGASSRNAGHVRPDAFRGFSAYAKVHGAQQALKIIQDERLVLERVDEFVKEHNVECDFNFTTTFDVCMTPEFAAYEAESLEAFKKAGGDTSHITFYEGDQAKEKTRVPGAVAAYEWPAGSSHPAKLAQFLLQAVISKGAKLFTFCPATEIERSGASPETWKVHTPRGTIEAEKIIHCTNAHAALLLPQLEAYIRPNRAQAHSLVPVSAFSGQKALQSTFFAPLQPPPLLLSDPTQGRCRFSTDDSRYNEEIAQDALRTFGDIFPAYSSETAMHGEGLDHAWTGIIAMTTDSVPFVGAIDSLPGQYICAGFNGHGMARIFTCAPAVAQLVLGKTWDETGLPDCFQFSDERLSRLSNGDLPSIW